MKEYLYNVYLTINGEEKKKEPFCCFGSTRNSKKGTHREPQQGICSRNTHTCNPSLDTTTVRCKRFMRSAVFIHFQRR
jgi:hypothetical protein